MVLAPKIRGFGLFLLGFGSKDLYFFSWLNPNEQKIKWGRSGKSQNRKRNSRVKKTKSGRTKVSKKQRRYNVPADTPRRAKAGVRRTYCNRGIRTETTGYQRSFIGLNHDHWVHKHRNHSCAGSIPAVESVHVILCKAEFSPVKSALCGQTVS